MNQRLVLIINLWLKGDDMVEFEAFERSVAEILTAHGGKLERAIRIVRAADEPFEIHIVTFPDELALKAYRSDPRTMALSAKRQMVISETVIMRGYDVTPYG